MVAINKILLPECTGGGCGGDTDTCRDSRVHRHNAENRVPATGDHRRTVATGRWLTRDPIGYQGGINLYAYVESDPVGRVDPGGLISPDRGLPLEPHHPGGPLEPPKSENVRCTDLDTCAVLLRKTMILIAVLASHETWDLLHQTERHAIERQDYARALDRCMGLYTKKCRKRPICQPAPAPVPVEAPEPTRPTIAVPRAPDWPGLHIHLPPPPPAPAVGAVVVAVLLVIILSPVGG